MNDRRFFQSGELSERIQAGEELIHPEDVPRHIGGDQGTMQGKIREGSEEVQQSGQGNHGNRGTHVYGQSELPGTNDPHGQGEYGSATVVTLGEIDAIEPELDPNIKPAPRTAAQIIAELRMRQQMK